MILKTRHPAAGTARIRGVRGLIIDSAAIICVLFVVATSAVITKELVARNGGPGFAAAELDQPSAAGPVAPLTISDPLLEEAEPASELVASGEVLVDDTSVRWFNGRAVRPARTVWMTVTAYSPDERSCPGTADGITASLHHVETNGHRLVAADTRLLPLGAMLSIPGYDSEQVVPVLDRGGKIKGYRLDVLFATHEQARQWGVRRLPITIWEYADGQGSENWRKIRDSKP